MKLLFVATCAALLLGSCSQKPTPKPASTTERVGTKTFDLICTQDPEPGKPAPTPVRFSIDLNSMVLNMNGDRQLYSIDGINNVVLVINDGTHDDHDLMTINRGDGRWNNEEPGATYKGRCKLASYTAIPRLF